MRHLSAFWAVTVILTVSILVPIEAHGQGRLNWWLRASSRIAITDKWSSEVELQGRRQNDMSEHLMEYPLLYSVRAWLHYDISESLKVTVSPFAWFEHFSLREDGYIDKAHEYRFTAAISRTVVAGRSFKLYGRPAIEYRALQGKADEIRPRAQVGIIWQVGKSFAIRPYEEIMYTYSTGSGKVAFDQNRLGAGFVLSLSRTLRTEAGLIHIVRASAYGEHVFLNFYYNIGT